MANFLVAQVEVTDPSWIPDYAASVHHLVHRHGGKYLTRSGKIRTLEGDESTLSLIAILEFPTDEALQAFVDDPDYAPYAAARQAGSNSHFVAIDDSDVAGTIPYLTAGG